MKDFTKISTQTQSAVGFDAGLRSFMLKVYNYMALALAVSGTVAYFGGTSEAFINMLMTNPILRFAVLLAPLGMVIFLSVRIHKMSTQTAQLTFWVYSAITGLSLCGIFTLYTQASIASAFFITASTFAAVSLYGYTTKRDLTGVGHFMMMGLIGIIIASIVNIFIGSSALQFAVSIISVIVFVGLIAYDNQKLKATYYEVAGSAELSGKYAILGALNLYLDFINLFISFLRLVADRR